MKAVLQRVKSANVSVDGQIVGEIQTGILVLLALADGDDIHIAQKMIDKILKYRIFDDEQGKMGLNVQQVNGNILLVSQFTLMANTHKGLRPDFAPAMPPQQAEQLFQQTVAYAQSLLPNLQTGIFAADMQVSLVNDGPVTFILEM
ncbi:D-aminoacyl-tRNA deacylase [Moraxella sp. ZY210820]|uniref:D-aminoacyl-tRNA deacylase n=1 Tax=unclassified Moraxella TaxID=2685852 RepID=UPI00272F6D69|nr:D-aminoacyl-tRNA deacylase [Moraxella sp. ZY210820]WLF84023.1 D-aminoacyl-tRNA deacylase [Moraxella sp. ZY210820]